MFLLFKSVIYSKQKIIANKAFDQIFDSFLQSTAGIIEFFTIFYFFRGLNNKYILIETGRIL